jgi:hypothetical protein
MKLKPAATRAAAEAATRAGEPLPYEFVDNYTITVPAVSDATKRTYIDAWVYITSFDGPGGTDSIRVRRYAGGDASKILYLASDGKLQAGPNGTVKSSNAMIFKFGGIVGLGSGTDGDLYDATDVKFNPSAVIPTDDYASVPVYELTEWNAEIKDISSSEYITFGNLKKGKGDPCMLIGYTASEIAAWDETDFNSAMATALYRTPTTYEDVSLTGGPATPIAGATQTYWKDWEVGVLRYTFTSTEDSTPSTSAYPTGTTTTLKYGFYAEGTPDVAKVPLVAQGKVAAGTYSLPAFQLRDTAVGKLSNTGQNVRYQSSTPSTATASYRLGFDAAAADPVWANSHNYGFNVRCVAR